MTIVAAQCRAARALIEWTQMRLSTASGVPKSVIAAFETGRKTPAGSELDKLRHGLEEAGVVFIAENGGGSGVRLKFNRSQVKQIDRMENEGGPVRDDDI